jgi:predicted negative regulator of RcsB-dependent stress response
MSGRADYLPIMADCERGVGRPERALALASEPDAASLDQDARAEMAIVVAGALRDLDRLEEADAALSASMPARAPAEQWVARLHYARGDVLAELGRTDEAVASFAAAEAADVEGSLDAGSRVVELLA